MAHTSLYPDTRELLVRSMAQDHRTLDCLSPALVQASWQRSQALLNHYSKYPGLLNRFGYRLYRTSSQEAAERPSIDTMAFRGAGMLLGFLLLLQLLAAPTCLSHDEVGDKTCLYTIKVISVPVRGSQTSPTVAITFYNSLGQEAYFPAVPTSHEPECYSTAEVYNTSTPCLPDICKMRLHFDKLDADIVTPPRVFLTSVEVGNLLIGEGKKRRFDVNGWLAIDEPPFLIDRTFDLCYWMSMPRTTTTRAATTTMTTSGTTNCTTYTTIDGSTTITSSFCSITTEIPF